MTQPVVTNSLKLLTRLPGASVVPGWLQPGNNLIVVTPGGGGGGRMAGQGVFGNCGTGSPRNVLSGSQ